MKGWAGFFVAGALEAALGPYAKRLYMVAEMTVYAVALVWPLPLMDLTEESAFK